MFKTLKNAWGIIDLKKKMLFTLFIVVLYRLGAQIPVPFIDAAQLSGFQEMMNGGIFQYLNIISGQALGNATLFALGVSPYITASIVVQLLTIAIPALEKWAKEGEEGKKKINVLTRIITVVLALITSIGYVMMLRNNGGASMFDFGSQVTHEAIYGFAYVIVVLCYCAGAAIVMWMAEKINESGIGNGISIILFANIIAGFGSTAAALWDIIFKEGGFKGFDWVGLLVAIGFAILALAMLVTIVWMSDAERRIPIQYAKRVVGRKMYGGQNTNLPLKVNMTGVMPIIFANSIVTIPATIAMLTKNASWTWVDKALLWCIRLIVPNFHVGKNAADEFIADEITKVNDWLVKFTENWLGNTSFIYLAVFAVLLVAFAYFYVAISFNPVEVANNIKNNGGMIPGIRSGRPTIDFIKKVLYRVTLIGALLVVLIACTPMLVNDILSIEAIKTAIEKARNVDYSLVFATLAFSGSSLMIVVGVALETVRELEAQMSLRNYKGFLD